MKEQCIYWGFYGTEQAQYDAFKLLITFWFTLSDAVLVNTAELLERAGCPITADNLFYIDVQGHFYVC